MLPICHICVPKSRSNQHTTRCPYCLHRAAPRGGWSTLPAFLSPQTACQPVISCQFANLLTHKIQPSLLQPRVPRLQETQDSKRLKSFIRILIQMCCVMHISSTAPMPISCHLATCQQHSPQPSGVHSLLLLTHGPPDLDPDQKLDPDPTMVSLPLAHSPPHTSGVSALPLLLTTCIQDHSSCSSSTQPNPPHNCTLITHFTSYK